MALDPRLTRTPALALLLVATWAVMKFVVIPLSAIVPLAMPPPLQFFVGADVPSGSSQVVSPPSAPNFPLETVYSYGLRLVFDWRYYPD